MRMLEPEQWRVMGVLISLCGAKARLHDVLKKQDASPEAVVDLSERGLIVAKLDGDEIDLTPGLIKTYRRTVVLGLSRAGEFFPGEDPHRVLRSIGRSRHGLCLTYLLGMIALDDLAELAREGLICAETAHEPVDLSDARQTWRGSLTVTLPGGEELLKNDVNVRTNKTGQLYCERY